MLRLVKLMVLLGLGLWGVTGFYGGADAPDRHGLSATTTDDGPPATLETTASPATILPATVRRLADAPVAGPLHPAIIGASQPLPIPASLALPVASPALHDIRRVTSSSANVRGGPSTSHSVVGRLTQGEEIEVIAQDSSGWLHIRMQGDGIDGWVSDRLIGPKS